MVTIFNNDSGAEIGQLSDDQFQLLADQLEEESATDDNYFINRSTIDVLAAAGASEELVSLLERALDDNGEAEIRWTRSA
jgi:hypothetical protein